jgi:hypothetical protein
VLELIELLVAMIAEKNVRFILGNGTGMGF